MVMNPIEEKMLLIRKKAQQLESLSKMNQEYEIRRLAIDIKLLIHQVMLEMGMWKGN